VFIPLARAARTAAAHGSDANTRRHFRWNAGDRVTTLFIARTIVF